MGPDASALSPCNLLPIQQPELVLKYESDHVTPLLGTLPWLTILLRVRVLTVTLEALCDLPPLISLTPADSAAATVLFAVPPTHSECFCLRAFALALLSAWNPLCPDISGVSL